MRLNKNISLWAGCAIALAAGVFLLTPSVSFAQSAGESLEREAQAIDRMIMCPVCPAETIDQAQVEISFQMRAIIREMLSAGSSREEILDYFVDRYGLDILAAPPKSGVNLLAWILPVVGVAAGLVGVFLVIRAMTGRQSGGPQPSAAGGALVEVGQDRAADPEFAPYLVIADRLLAARRSTTANASVDFDPATSGEADEFDGEREPPGEDSPEGGHSRG